MHTLLHVTLIFIIQWQVDTVKQCAKNQNQVLSEQKKELKPPMYVKKKFSNKNFICFFFGMNSSQVHY